MSVVIVVERQRQSKHGETRERHIYVSNLGKKKAQDFAKLIRGHWSIENQLHWVKDAIFREDDSTITHNNAASNCAILRTIGVNLFRLHKHESLKKAVIIFANKIKLLYQLMRT
jgi:predicted transposase YbfD/YdcC